MRSLTRLSAMVIAPAFLALGTLAAQGTRVRTVVDSVEGGVGGVAVDRLGAIYVADFRETVWKVEPPWGDGRTLALQGQLRHYCHELTLMRRSDYGNRDRA